MLESVLRVVIEAGREIMRFYRSGGEVSYKEDRTPLTEADLKAHSLITSFLKESFPFIPVLSEEGEIPPYEERKHWREFWLVDPLDGTKEFLKGLGEFTVNVALVRNGKPVLGVVYAPAKGVLYCAEEGEGARRLRINGMEITENVLLPTRTGKPGPIRVVVSRSHMDEKTRLFVNGLREKYGSVELLSAGSSLKFCLLAEGEAHIYPRLSPTMEWDTAAGHWVLAEAGGRVLTAEGELKYNKENLRNPPFVAVAPYFREGLSFLNDVLK